MPWHRRTVLGKLANFPSGGYRSPKHRRHWSLSAGCAAGFELLGFGMGFHAVPRSGGLAATFSRERERHCRAFPCPEPEETQSRLQLPLVRESLGSWNLLVPARVPAAQRQIGPVSASGERAGRCPIRSC